MFGGAFNPPLNSHFSLAEQIVNENKQVEKVIFVPVNVKYNKEGLASNEDRFFMLQKICENNEGIEVSDIEITSQRQLYTIEMDSPRPLYTIETLQELQKQYPEYEIAFMIRK